MKVYFNNFDLTSICRILNVNRPLMPPIIVTSSNIPGRDGQFVYYKQFNSTSIQVEIIIITKNKTLLRNKIRELSSKINYNEPKKLVFDDEPDKYIMAMISENTEIEELLTYGKCTLNFFCPDPYWYAVNDDIIVKNSGGTFTFQRKGTVESYPLIEIEGASTSNGSISFFDGVNNIKFTGQLNSGEKLILDSSLMTAYIINQNNIKQSVIQKLSTLDFLVLESGLNELTIKAQNGAVISKIKINCNSRWI